MHIVLLSGGSGKRLWPLSNDIRSKQFIKLFPQQDGKYLSMAQRVYRQIRKADPDADITIATSKSQVSTLKNQLGNAIDISVEPCRRDTFPTIALVSTYLHDVKGVGVDEAIAVCPVDPYVDTDYFQSVKKLTQLASMGIAELMLMGIEPTYPSEKYGYLIPQSLDEISLVKEFKEKPNAKTAAKYMKKGALWNSGVFAFRLGHVLEQAHQLLNFQGYQDLYDAYEELEKISFDYAVVEKEKSIGVLRYHGKWKDIGTWNTLADVMQEDSVGNVIFDDSCHDTHVINELEVPILCMGLNHLVISASPEGILVSDKHRSSFIKPYVEQITQPIMFAEKSWGSFRVINIEDDSLTARITLKAKKGMNYHSHQHRDEVWTIVKGNGVVKVNDEERNVHVGEVINLPCGSKHKITAVTDMTIIEVQLGREIHRDDKIKCEE